jgi:protein ImuB
MAIVPDGPPTWFRWGGDEHAIVHAAGPERIETGWWRKCDIRRDYYVATSRTGERFWLYRDRQQEAWFVHGKFD